MLCFMKTAASLTSAAVKMQEAVPTTTKRALCIHNWAVRYALPNYEIFHRKEALDRAHYLFPNNA